MKTTQNLLLAGICLAVPLSALANCSSAYSSYLSGGVFARTALSSQPECFGGGATTSLVLVGATAGQQLSAIADALSWRRAAPGVPTLAGHDEIKGLAAGDAASAWNLWGNLSDVDSDQRFSNLAGTTSKNHFDIQNYIVAADFAWSPTLVTGVSAAIDKGDISGINLAPGEEKNELTSEGYMIAPYASWQLSEQLAVDASVGLGRGRVEAIDSSTQDVDRWFAGTNLNYERWLENWQLAGRASYLHAEEAYDDIHLRSETEAELGLNRLENSAATNKLDRLELGGRVGYWLNGWMPYAGLKYVDDVNRSTTQDFAPSNPIGREAWVWSLGVNLFSLSNGITGGLAYEQEEGRSNQTSSSVMANLSIRL
jgi:hypothetical protein